MEAIGGPWFALVVAVLATWRLAHLVAHEDGPFDVVVAARRAAGAGVLGRLMDCPYCLSLWLAAPFAAYVAIDFATGVALWLAISGGACLVEGVAAAHEARIAADATAHAATAEASGDAAGISPRTGTPP